MQEVTNYILNRLIDLLHYKNADVKGGGSRLFTLYICIFMCYISGAV
ncbi:MAG: hypothetical protein LIO41_01465 [Ruminococcus sp.]|nr:hypothetical protein [Ruminococcus sp.]